MTATKTLTAVNVDENGGVMCVFSDTGIYYTSLEHLQSEIKQASANFDSHLQMLLLMLWVKDKVIGRTAVLDTENETNVVTTHAYL
jgi:hypothetical protein